MKFNLSQVKEPHFIDVPGTYTLKVSKVDTSGKTTNNNPIFKVSFNDKDGGMFTDEFVITDNALWKLKALQKALKLPDEFEADMMVGRYVVAELYLKDEKTTSGNIFKKTTCKAYSESSLQQSLTAEANEKF